MDVILNKTPEQMRPLLFGSLVSCLFSEDSDNECPFARLRKTLTTEEKYDYVMTLNEEEIRYFLHLHDRCMQRRISL